MKRSSTVFLQAVVALIGLSSLALILWEPHLEGRNANATTFEIYFEDPFLAYAYFASIAYFMALYQAFRLLGYIGKNEVFSQKSVRSLRIIKYCAISLVCFIVGALAWIMITQTGKDDIAGGVAMGVMMVFVSAVVATVAAVFERLLQKAVDMKSENDLTV